jgi:hypothetical protein
MPPNQLDPRSTLVDQLGLHHRVLLYGEPAADRCNVAAPKQRLPAGRPAYSMEGGARASRAVGHDPSEAMTIELVFTAYRLHETSSAVA